MVTALAGAYIVLAGVPQLLPLGAAARGAQAGDAIGALLAVLALWSLAASRARPAPSAVDLAAASWLAVVVSACGIAVARATLPVTVAAREAAVALSLVSVYAALRLLVNRGLIATAVRALALMAALGSAAGLIGMAMAGAGVDTSLVWPGSTPYPYLGTAARAQGWTRSPNMLASVAVTGALAWALVAVRDGSNWTRRTWWMPAVIAVGLLATLSKSAACLVAGLSVAAAWTGWVRGTRFRLAASALGVAAALAYLLLSHVTVTNVSAVDRLVAGRFIAGAPLAEVSFRGETYGVYRTNYWFNKAASIAAIRQHFPWGLGPGGQNAFTTARMRAGSHPATLWAADPHSTYVGTLSELGLAGLAGLVALGAALANALRCAHAKGWMGDLRLATMALAAAIYVALEAVTIDVMNFRHYWVAAALLASLSTQTPGEAERGQGAQESLRR